jgi:hypothetical protein
MEKLKAEVAKIYKVDMALLSDRYILGESHLRSDVFVRRVSAEGGPLPSEEMGRVRGRVALSFSKSLYPVLT